jgi:hypothetical protein
MVVVVVTCVFVDPASGVVVGILLGLGKGAFLESKAWVFCKLRQGDFVLAKFNCDLVPRRTPLRSTRSVRSDTGAGTAGLSGRNHGRLQVGEAGGGGAGVECFLSTLLSQMDGLK